VDSLIQNPWHLIRSILLVFLAVYIGIVTFLYLFQSNMIYFPGRNIEATPRALGLPFEDVRFKTDDGLSLYGWFIPASKPKGTILFYHGNGGNVSNCMETINLFHRLDMSIFIFDYRGYGASEGKPDEKGTYKDAEAALMWLKNRLNLPVGDIVFMGRSLGGAIAAWLAVKHPPKALILESTFTSVPDIAAGVYPWLPVGLLSRFRYPTIEYIRLIHCPLLVVHSPDDTLIPFSNGKHLFEAAHEPKEFLEITGNHNEGFILSGRLYSDGLTTFLSCYGRGQMP
jgi:fermentation-respiration switch protein FrsA (DUF1100 family)